MQQLRHGIEARGVMSFACAECRVMDTITRRYDYREYFVK